MKVCRFVSYGISIICCVYIAISAARFKTFVGVLFKAVNLMYYIVRIFANVIPLFFKTETLTFKSKTSTDLDIKNTLKFDRPFDCVDFELLLFKPCYKTWSENEVLKHGLTTTLSTPGI